MKINVEKYQKGTPRPHYLVGEAVYNQKGKVATLDAKVNFSSEENPSIADRTDKYMKNPHVNAGDCFFATWNAAHIIAQFSDCGDRTLRKEIIVKPYALVPSDVNLDLKVKIVEEKILSKKNISFSVGKIYGDFYSKDNKLLSIVANYCSEIK